MRLQKETLKANEDWYHLELSQMDQVGEQKEVGSPILLAIHSLLATFDLQGFQKTFLVVEVQSLDHSLDIWIDSQKIVVLQSRDLWNVVITSFSENYIVSTVPLWCHK